MNSFQNIINSIKSNYPNKEEIHLHEPVFLGNEKQYLTECIDSTYVSSIGKYVDLLEEKISRLVNVEKSVAVVNGTSGLQVALRIVGVKRDEEVLTQALSFAATTNAILLNGASPVFIDVDMDTMGLSPKSLKKFLEQNVEFKNGQPYNKLTNKRISACLPMHTFGFICRIGEIVEICNHYKIPVVEDAAEALGSGNADGMAGTFGDIGVFSLNGNKVITSGGGGILVSKSTQLMVAAKHLTTTAKIAHKYLYNHDQLGYNFRMPNINAALACAQLERMNEIVENKKKLYEGYEKMFGNHKMVKIPSTTKFWNYWLFSIELSNINERDEFLEYAYSNKIYARPCWNLLSSLEYNKNYQQTELTNSKLLFSKIVNIPSGANF